MLKMVKNTRETLLETCSNNRKIHFNELRERETEKKKG